METTMVTVLADPASIIPTGMAMVTITEVSPMKQGGMETTTGTVLEVGWYIL